MKTQTSLVTLQVRLQEWARQIHECKSRPAGMNVETWYIGFVRYCCRELFYIWYMIESL